MTDITSAADERLVLHPKDPAAPWYARIIEEAAKWLTSQSTSTILLLVIIGLLTYAGTGLPHVVTDMNDRQAKSNQEMMSRYEESLKQQNAFHERMVERVITSFDREVTNVKELVREMRAQR